MIPKPKYDITTTSFRGDLETEEELRQFLNEGFLKGLSDLGTARFLIKKGYKRIKK